MAAETREMLSPGALVAERYRVVSFLDEGGMGAVYRVEHLHMRKTFALKVLHRALVDRPEILARFEREAIAAGSVEHPNVAAATDFGRLPDGSFFLIMEFVRGRNLRDEVNGGALEAERATKIVRGIVAGVAAAHAKGIVHRDLKPENVMLVEHDGDPDFVKVLDFGIAKLEAPSAGTGVAAPLTRVGSLLGTLEYMSPEQAMGEPVDARSDLYSIGIIFYELLSGRCPFEGDAVRVIQQHVATQPPALPEAVAARVGPRIEGIVTKLLAKRPEDRYATAADLAAALAETAAKPRVVAELPARPRFTKVRVRLGILALSIALATIAAVISHVNGRQERGGSAEPDLAIDPPRPPVTAGSASSTSPLVELPPAPAPPESASAPGRRAMPAPPASSAPAHRRTGPGGIYIPPPKDWFK